MRYCAVCGKDISGKRPEAKYCSNRCQKRAKTAAGRLLSQPTPVEAPRPPKPKWPGFVQVAGPLLTPVELHCASVSDRDPRTGRSSYEDTEERNRKLFP
jgi:hypothetical protein